MKRRYRIVVWGPGGLGLVSAWEIARSQDLELVGVRAYNPEKHGVDIGTLLGTEPLGVKASTDAEKVLALDCDCVIFTPRDHGNYHTDQELFQLLAAGKNVVTALPYQHAHLVRDAAFMNQLRKACEEGQSTFHATGVDPDLISDRVLVALTGLCTDIKYLKLQENWDFNFTPPETLALCGFGKSPAEAKAMPVAAVIAENFVKQVCLAMEEALEVKYTRVVGEHEYAPTDKDITTATALIKAGTVGRVTHRWMGFTQEDSTRPFFTIEVNWVMGDTMLPKGVQPDQYWVATIEGRPSVKMIVDMKASMETRERFVQMGKHQSEPGYHAVVASILQAIPAIVEAPPGVMPVTLPPRRWKKSKKD